jgi:hypothetical protein
MKLVLLESLVARWTLSHTVAAAAWAVVIVLGLALALRGVEDPYPVTNNWKVYAGENATLRYPDNWQVRTCNPGHEFIELPGTIKTSYKGQKSYGLKIEGGGSYGCSNNKPERFDIYPETFVASDTPCIPATSTQGQRLENGLYLQLGEQDGEVFDIYIRQNRCFAPAEASVLHFVFVDPDARSGDATKYGMPRVKKDAFLQSSQYRDILALAASFRY